MLKRKDETVYVLDKRGRGRLCRTRAFTGPQRPRWRNLPLPLSAGNPQAFALNEFDPRNRAALFTRQGGVWTTCNLDAGFPTWRRLRGLSAARLRFEQAHATLTAQFYLVCLLNGPTVVRSPDGAQIA